MIRLIGHCNNNGTNSTEHLNEQVALNEMATIIEKKDGLGIEITVNSNDHMPAHMHVNDPSNHKIIARVLIPLNRPHHVNDITPYPGDTLTNTQKKIIFKALLSNDSETDLPIWKLSKRTWNMLHSDNRI